MVANDPDRRATLARAEELDALDAILPFDRRDQLAKLLTDEDVATLKHLAQEGMGDNTLRALASDLGYLEAWCQLAIGTPLPWPAPESLLLKFVAHHLFDPLKRTQDPTHGSRPTLRLDCVPSADSRPMVHTRRPPYQVTRPGPPYASLR